MSELENEEVIVDIEATEVVEPTEEEAVIAEEEVTE